MFSEVKECRVCGNKRLEVILDLGMQALTGVFPRERSQAVRSGPLVLVKCDERPETCGLVQLKHTYDPRELYGENYGYRSGLNPHMVRHLERKVREILNQVDLPEDALVIDIGSNDATTLKSYPTSRIERVGIDPIGSKLQKYYPPDIKLIPEVFSAELVRQRFGNRRASVITSFSMFYDIDEPMKLMRDVCKVLADDGIWVCEQSYLPAMMQRNSYDTVCHEHLEYYRMAQIRWMAERCGLVILDVEFNEINGGSFSFTAAKQGSSRVESRRVQLAIEMEDRQGLGTLGPYRSFAVRVDNTRKLLREFIAEAKRQGKRILALGASTKGNVLLQYCGITESDVPRIGEVNEEKFGCFTPGSLLPIVPEGEILEENPDYLMMLPWHFKTFFENAPRFFGRTLLFPLPEPHVVQARVSGPRDH